jgi:hypothetical protein
VFCTVEALVQPISVEVGMTTGVMVSGLAHRPPPSASSMVIPSSLARKANWSAKV